MHWVFDQAAPGLIVSKLRKWWNTTHGGDASVGGEESSRAVWLRKVHNSNVLFDSTGSRELSKEEACALTTWRSHHAFSGRCMLSKPPEEKHATTTAAAKSDSEAVGSARIVTDSEAYRHWEVRFLLRSTNEEPTTLLSVAPYYLPYSAAIDLLSNAPAVKEGLCKGWTSPSADNRRQYDKRIMETPLIYEEPYTFSVECTPQGMFLWSDHWKLWGDKIAPRCYEAGTFTLNPTTGSSTPGGPTRVSGHQSYVRLQWRVDPPTDGASSTAATLSVSLGQTCHDSVQGVAFHASSTPPRTPISVDTDVNHTSTSVSSPSSDFYWQNVYSTKLDIEDHASHALFVPYATLMEGGDQVILI